MKIAIDASDWKPDRWDGTRVYVENLLRHLPRVDKDNEYIYYYRESPGNRVEAANVTERLIPQRFLWTKTKLPRALFQDKPDVFFSPFHSLPYVRPWGLKTVVTIHDLAFFSFANYFRTMDRIFLHLDTSYAVKRADRLIAISSSTGSDLQKYYKIPASKISTIYHGFDAKDFHPIDNMKAIKQVTDKYRISSPYILFIGVLQPRKNLIRLMRAYERMVVKYPELKKYQLVLAGGRGWHDEQIIHMARELESSGRVVLTGRFDQGDEPALLNGASLFILPSLYEGFGLPVLEALACGTPVITSRVSSLPEVAGQAAVLIDPYDTQMMAEAMRKVLTDEGLRNELGQRGRKQVEKFSWLDTARETVKVFSSV